MNLITEKGRSAVALGITWTLMSVRKQSSASAILLYRLPWSYPNVWKLKSLSIFAVTLNVNTVDETSI